MTLENQQQAFSLDVAKLILFIYNKNFSVIMGGAHRIKDHDCLKGINIKNSQHAKHLAIDLIICSPLAFELNTAKDYQPFGHYWEDLDPFNMWGGAFARGDIFHFERRET